jgi:hypothetical protein
LDASLLKFHIYNSSQSLSFQYIITTFELRCTSNFDTTFIWLKYWQTWSYITNYYAKHVIFYSPQLIQIYWITYYVGSLTCGSDQSSNGLVTSQARFQCDLSSNGHSDALKPVATVIHQNLVQKINICTTIIHQKLVPKAKHIYRQPLSIKSLYRKLNIYTTIIQHP